MTVEFSFGGSSDLVSQIQEGAPADVFASADEANMEKLTGEDLQADDPQNFASNTLEIVTPPDNPAGITSFADLAKDGVNVVVCAPEVPCGAATVKARGGHRRDPDPGERGAVGHRRAGQGDLRRGGRRARLRHGRDRGGRRGARRTVPRVQRHREHLPDRGARRTRRTATWPRTSSTSCSATPGRPSSRRPASPSHDQPSGRSPRSGPSGCLDGSTSRRSSGRRSCCSRSSRSWPRSTGRTSAR